MNRQVSWHWSTILHARILFPITPHHAYISGFFCFNTTLCLSTTYILLCKCKIMQSHTICSHTHIFQPAFPAVGFPSSHFCSCICKSSCSELDLPLLDTSPNLGQNAQLNNIIIFITLGHLLPDSRLVQFLIPNHSLRTEQFINLQSILYE